MGEEGTYGSPATNFTKVPISAIGGNWFSQNLIDNPEIRGNRNPAAPVLGNKVVNGNFTCPMHYDAIGWMLKNSIGTPVTTGSDPYTHIGKVGFSGASAGYLQDGMTFEHQFPDIAVPEYHDYLGCKVSTFAASVTPEGVVTFDINIIGADADVDNGVAIDASPIEYTSVAQSHFTGSMELLGGSIAYIQSVDFTLDNGLDDSQYVVGGAGALSELPENMASVTGNVTALFQSNALLEAAIANTETSMKLVWTGVGAHAGHSLTFDIPELVLEPAAPTVSGDKGVLITLPFRAYYANHADATILKYTLVNDVSSYAAIAAS
jgi:hypothetical protein